jgi:hypothetical protein
VRKKLIGSIPLYCDEVTGELFVDPSDIEGQQTEKVLCVDGSEITSLPPTQTGDLPPCQTRGPT